MHLAVMNPYRAVRPQNSGIGAELIRLRRAQTFTIYTFYFMLNQ
jgi:hypothetical protein